MDESLAAVGRALSDSRFDLAGLGIRDRDAAHVLAVLIDRSPLPVTVLMQGLVGVTLRPAVVRTGIRGLDTREAHSLDAPEGRFCCWRTARLETADGELAAGVFLLWLPYDERDQRGLDASTCRDLDAGAESAGTILGRLPGGMWREQRRACAAAVLDEITGEDVSVMSRAVLVTGGQAVAIAEENWMSVFVKSLA